jgi:hypothetical protein
MPNRTIIIGDVHGCLLELDHLLQQLNPTSDDHLVFIGDLIDRGPHSVEVVQRVYELSHMHRLDLILGNHEEKFLRYADHIQSNTGFEKEMTGTEEFDAYLQKFKPEHYDLLRSSHWFMKFSQHGLILVHAGLPARLTLDGIKRVVWGQEKQFGKSFRLMNKLRYEDGNGDFLALNTETRDSVFWADRYRGNYGKAIFGHQPFLQEQPRLFNHAIGLDTGCVYGGWLSAYIFDQNGEHRLLSVPARKCYHG